MDFGAGAEPRDQIGFDFRQRPARVRAQIGFDRFQLGPGRSASAAPLGFCGCGRESFPARRSLERLYDVFDDFLGVAEHHHRVLSM